MTWRKMIQIDEEQCDGCGECVTGCAEGAIAIIDGKARLVSEVYCDGLGACLGHCPQGAITMEEREAEAFDEVKTREHLERLRNRKSGPGPLPLAAAPHQCPGSMARSLGTSAGAFKAGESGPIGPQSSELTNWPVQLTLVPPNAPYFRGADLLLVADCVPFACADFHRRFLRGKPVVIGCPKLDRAESYVQKLAEIVRTAEPRSLSVVHMEVPCCSGLTRVAQVALGMAESNTPLTDVTVGIGGEVITSVEAAPLTLRP
ncbi:MAG: ATP-binding protein [Candidatus Methylomirabilales bacterium]